MVEVNEKFVFIFLFQYLCTVRLKSGHLNNIQIKNNELF